MLLGAFAVFATLRVALVRTADLPTVTPDEPGTWAIARLLSGTEGDLLMQHMPRYPLLPGAVLAPLWSLPVDAVTRYRLALVVLSALTVVAAVLVRATIRRLGGDPLVSAIGLAVVLLSASTSYAGAFTWAEPLALCWMALLGYCTVAVGMVPVAADRTPQVGWAPVLAASAAAGAAPYVHGRLGLAPVIWLGLLVATRRRLGTRTSMWAAATTVATALVLRPLDGIVGARLWTDAEPALAGDPAGWLLDPGFLGTLATTVVGQLWYAVVTSAGLAVAGAALLVTMVLRPSRGGERVAGAALGALVLSNLVVSSVVVAGFLHTDRTRPGSTLSAPRWDHLIYGRYTDAAVVLMGALGVLWCWRQRDRGRLVVPFVVAAISATVAAGVVAATMAGRSLDGSFTPNIAGLSALPVARTDPDLAAWTVAGVVVIVLMAAAAHEGRRSFGIAVVTWLSLGAVAGTNDALRLHRFDLGVDLADRLSAAPRGDATVEVASDAAEHPSLRMSIFATQYQLLSEGWTTRFTGLASEDLARAGDGADVVLLTDGVVPLDPDFVAVAQYDGVTAWRRP